MSEERSMVDLLRERREAAQKLELCPFCGGSGYNTLNILCDEYGRYYVLCYQDTTGAGCGMESGRRHSLEELIDYWNERN